MPAASLMAQSCMVFSERRDPLLATLAQDLHSPRTHANAVYSPIVSSFHRSSLPVSRLSA